MKDDPSWIIATVASFIWDVICLLIVLYLLMGVL